MKKEKDLHFNHWEKGKYSESNDIFDHYRSVNLPVKQERSNQIFNFVQSQYLKNAGMYNGKKIIEVGCNSGRNLDLFYNNSFETFGVDINADVIDFCKGHFREQKDNFFKEDVFNNSISFFSKFEDNFFDFCFSMGVLMHMPHSENKKQLVGEMARVSKTLFLYELCRSENITMNSISNVEHFEDKGYFIYSEDYSLYGHGIKPHLDLRQNNLLFFSNSN